MGLHNSSKEEEEEEEEEEELRWREIKEIHSPMRVRISLGHQIQIHNIDIAICSLGFDIFAFSRTGIVHPSPPMLMVFDGAERNTCVDISLTHRSKPSSCEGSRGMNPIK